MRPGPRAATSVFLLLALVGVGACGGGGGGGTAGPTGPTPTFFTFQSAIAVVGQGNVNGGSVHAGTGSLNAAGFNQPLGHVQVANGTLFVGDAGNNRVLGFNPVPTGLGQPASIVLGAEDFTTPTSGTSAVRMTGPSSCWIASGALFVADRNNGRVLVWSPVPTTTGTAAILVLGKLGLTDPDPMSGQVDPTSGPNGLGFPADVCVAANRIVVADTLNHRVMVWNGIPASHGADASLVLGQPDFATVTSGLSPVKMNQPSGVWTDGTRLVVADTGNHRVLVWNTFPTANGQAADFAIGQPDLSTGVAAAGAQGLNQPRSVAADAGQLYVADTGNNRVLVFTPVPTFGGAAALRVLGQGTMDGTTGNDDNQDALSDGAPTARTLSGPRGVTSIGTQLFVTDSLNHRVLVFQAN